MHTCLKPVLQASSVTASLRLTAEWNGEEREGLLVAHTHLLELYLINHFKDKPALANNGESPKDSSSMPLQMVWQEALHDSVASMAVITVANDAVALVGVAFKHAKAAVLQWCPRESAFKTLSLHYFERVEWADGLMGEACPMPSLRTTPASSDHAPLAVMSIFQSRFALFTFDSTPTSQEEGFDDAKEKAYPQPASFNLVPKTAVFPWSRLLAPPNHLRQVQQGGSFNDDSSIDGVGPVKDWVWMPGFRGPTLAILHQTAEKPFCDVARAEAASSIHTRGALDNHAVSLVTLTPTTASATTNDCSSEDHDGSTLLLGDGSRWIPSTIGYLPGLPFDSHRLIVMEGNKDDARGGGAKNDPPAKRRSPASAPPLLVLTGSGIVLVDAVSCSVSAAMACSPYAPRLSHNSLFKWTSKCDDGCQVRSLEGASVTPVSPHWALLTPRQLQDESPAQSAVALLDGAWMLRVAPRDKIRLSLHPIHPNNLLLAKQLSFSGPACAALLFTVRDTASRDFGVFWGSASTDAKVLVLRGSKAARQEVKDGKAGVEVEEEDAFLYGPAPIRKSFDPRAAAAAAPPPYSTQHLKGVFDIEFDTWSLESVPVTWPCWGCLPDIAALSNNNPHSDDVDSPLSNGGDCLVLPVGRDGELRLGRVQADCSLPLQPTTTVFLGQLCKAIFALSSSSSSKDINNPTRYLVVSTASASLAMQCSFSTTTLDNPGDSAGEGGGCALQLEEVEESAAFLEGPTLLAVDLFDGGGILQVWQEGLQVLSGDLQTTLTTMSFPSSASRISKTTYIDGTLAVLWADSSLLLLYTIRAANDGAGIQVNLANTLQDISTFSLVNHRSLANHWRKEGGEGSLLLLAWMSRSDGALHLDVLGSGGNGVVFPRFSLLEPTISSYSGPPDEKHQKTKDDFHDNDVKSSIKDIAMHHHSRTDCTYIVAMTGDLILRMYRLAANNELVSVPYDGTAASSSSSWMGFFANNGKEHVTVHPVPLDDDNLAISLAMSDGEARNLTLLVHFGTIFGMPRVHVMSPEVTSPCAFLYPSFTKHRENRDQCRHRECKSSLPAMAYFDAREKSLAVTSPYSNDGHGKASPYNYLWLESSTPMLLGPPLLPIVDREVVGRVAKNPGDEKDPTANTTTTTDDDEEYEEEDGRDEPNKITDPIKPFSLWGRGHVLHINSFQGSIIVTLATPHPFLLPSDDYAPLSDNLHWPPIQSTKNSRPESLQPPRSHIDWNAAVTHKHCVLLVAKESLRPVDRIELTPEEHVTCLNGSVLLRHQRDRSYTTTTLKEAMPFLAVGTSWIKGEDRPCRGRCLLFQIAKVVPRDPSLPETGMALRCVRAELLRGPVTSLASMLDTFLVIGGATRVMVYGFGPSPEDESFNPRAAPGATLNPAPIDDDDALVPLAFIECHAAVQWVACVKALILVGDLGGGVAMHVFQEEPKLRVTTLSRDPSPWLPVSHVECLLSPHQQQALRRTNNPKNDPVVGKKNQPLMESLIVGASEQGLHFWAYAPWLAKSVLGERLIDRGALSLWSPITRLLPVNNFFRNRPKKEQSFVLSRQSIYVSLLDGSVLLLASIPPIPLDDNKKASVDAGGGVWEEGEVAPPFALLYALQTALVDALPSLGGLHPRQSRLRRLVIGAGPCSPLATHCLDGILLGRVWSDARIFFALQEPSNNNDDNEGDEHEDGEDETFYARGFPALLKVVRKAVPDVADQAASMVAIKRAWHHCFPLQHMH